MIENKLFEDSADFLAGSCMKTPEEALRLVAETLHLEEDVTDELVADFIKYLEEIEQVECENCGWWGYPGESCDCQDEFRCGDCCNSLEDCTCEDEDD